MSSAFGGLHNSLLAMTPARQRQGGGIEVRFEHRLVSIAVSSSHDVFVNEAKEIRFRYG
jgi:hypothetical protein